MSWHGTAWITTIQDNKYGRDGQQQRVGDTKRHHHPGVHTNLPKIVPCIAQHNTQNSTIRQTQHRQKNRRIHIIDVSQETINRPISLLISIRCILYCIISVLPVECARTIMPINKMECRRVQCAQMYYTITRAHTTFPFSVCVYCFDILLLLLLVVFVDWMKWMDVECVCDRQCSGATIRYQSYKKRCGLRYVCCVTLLLHLHTRIQWTKRVDAYIFVAAMAFSLLFQGYWNVFHFVMRVSNPVDNVYADVCMICSFFYDSVFRCYVHSRWLPTFGCYLWKKKNKSM